MADDATRALLCRESVPFRVEPKGSMDIIGLKDLIKEKGINTTEHAALAKDLTLWNFNLEGEDGIGSDSFRHYG